MSIELKSLSELVSYLDLGKSINVAWDAGGDETPVSITIAGRHVSTIRNETGSHLRSLIVDVLNLPNSGSTYAVGSGTLLMEGNDLYIQYESSSHGIDWNPVTNVEVRTNERVTSGKKFLLSVKS